MKKIRRILRAVQPAIAGGLTGVGFGQMIQYHQYLLGSLLMAGGVFLFSALFWWRWTWGK